MERPFVLHMMVMEMCVWKRSLQVLLLEIFDIAQEVKNI